MQKPTTYEINQLIDEGVASLIKEHAKNASTGASQGYVGGTPRQIPGHFVEMFRRVVAAFDPGTFPEFERAIADPGDPDLNDVLKDLYRLLDTILKENKAQAAVAGS
jgi:hypothetical protein